MSRKSVLIILMALGISSVIGSIRIPTVNATWVGGHITSDTTWKLEASPFVVIDNIVVDPNVTLTIEAGAEIKFGADFFIQVDQNAKLIAEGNGATPITFTSNKLSPSKADWNTITVLGGSYGQLILRHCQIFYATNGVTIEARSGEVIIQDTTIQQCTRAIFFPLSGANVTIATSLITQNDEGIKSTPPEAVGLANVTIIGCTFSYNVNFALIQDYYYDIHNVKIEGNSIFENGKGLVLRGSGALYDITISQNQVSSNKGDGIVVEGWAAWKGIYNVVVSNNTVRSNGGSGIRMSTGSSYFLYNCLVTNNTVLLNDADGIQLSVPYDWLNKNGDLYNNTVSGNMVKLNKGAGVSLSGGDDRAYDNKVFGNILGSNIQAGLSFSSRSASLSDINYAWNNSVSNGDIGVSVAGNFRLAMSNSTIAYNEHGVLLSSTKDNKFGYNNILSNKFGMNVTSGATVNATYNYWGNETGPYHVSMNPTGTGNPVNGDGLNLRFIPFLTSPAGSVNERPVAILRVDKTSPMFNETVVIDAINSTDDGRLDYYLFDFGDGTNSSWTALPIVTHKYSQEGKYNATLIVMDDFGVTSLDGNLVYVTITVVPEFPSFLILPLFMIITLLAVIVYRRNIPRDHYMHHRN